MQGNHNIDVNAALAPAPAVSASGIWQYVGREAPTRPAQPAAAAAAKKQPPPPPEHEPSFVELVSSPCSRFVALTPLQVADFAARHSVVFVPKADGHAVGGKRVYSFGKHSV